ncbi:MAG TPA: NAD(P)/FAD-dependent oxidoreductase [Aquifex aeolicus]|nr:NAD(P)/FAD-dependent oxidoreductase [Aquificales bacterium]HIQ25868.1 NAD(P)/FAD-dependent oxidoreductase [Aquifex aeolicus]
MDLVIIGCGSGGISAAKEALKYTKNILCVDRSPEWIGGVCLNRGCVPTKHLREGAYLYDRLTLSGIYGFPPLSPLLNLQSAIEGAQTKVIKPIREGIYKFLRSKGVKFLFSQEVEFLNPSTLRVGSKTVTSKYFLVATGSSPSSVGGISPDGEFIFDTDNFWEINKTPKKVVIVGGGVSGVEFAYILSRYGAKEIHLIEVGKTLLPTVENLSADIVRRLERTLKGLRIKLHTKTAVEDIDKNSQRVKLTSGELLEEVDAVILTVGRKPNTHSLGLERIGVSLTQRGHIEVNEKYQTSVENVYAVGDVIDTPAFAHVASHEAKLAVRNIFEKTSKRLDYTLVPSVVYSVYEIGSFGLGEKQLKAQGVEYKISNLTFKAVAKALSEGEEGLIKVFHTPEGRILGANVLSKKRSDSILHLLILAKKGGLDVNGLREIVWAHPTIEEILELL